METVRYAVDRNRGISDFQPNPDFQYLRITVGGRIAFLARGYVDSDSRGPIDVWYSAEREVLRLQNGRLAGATGLTTEWRGVTLPAMESWSKLAAAAKPVSWVRERDVMPGYRYGIKDQLTLRAISPPQKSALLGIDPKALTWFDEQRLQEPEAVGEKLRLSPAGSVTSLPPARYAVDLRNGAETVIYGEQCLAPELCFTWQRWPVDAPASRRR